LNNPCFLQVLKLIQFICLFYRAISAHSLGGATALKSDSSLVVWGSDFYGADISSVASSLTSGVAKVATTSASFAVLKLDGSVVYWNMDPSSDDSQLAQNVADLQCNYAGSCAVLKTDGSVFTWGSESSGGSITPIKANLSGNVVSIHPLRSGFYARKQDGSVVMWGDSYQAYGPDLRGI
jgi:alpha-tubulin suppressor-like RCC1 family protein